MQCSSEGTKVNLAESSDNNCLQLLIQITRQFSLQIRIYISLGAELNAVCALIDEPAGVEFISITTIPILIKLMCSYQFYCKLPNIFAESRRTSHYLQPLQDPT